jgi:putative tryptophan/tyrosine transport system substrate-binding protein
MAHLRSTLQRLPLWFGLALKWAPGFAIGLVFGLVFGLTAVAPARAAEPMVVVVISERSASYLEAAEVLVRELERGAPERGGVARADIALMTSGEYATAPGVAPKLFIAVGAGASSVLAARESRIPQIATLLPATSFEQIMQATGRKPSAVFSAVYLSQPLARQFDLIRLALPEARRVGVLLGADSQSQAPALQAAALSRGLELASALVGPGETAYPALQKVLEDADLLLAVPSPQVYNSSSIQNILLSSYRARVPLVGFSQSYVQAGAVFAVYSTPAMVSRQAAVMARNLLMGRGLPAAPQYPQDFNVTVNEQVARSLGLKLDAAVLADRLRQLERTP